MKKLKKASALIVATGMLLAALAGCGAAKEDPIQDALGYSGDTVFATFDGDKITAADYLPWLANYAQYMGQRGITWDQDMGDGTTAREFVKTEVMETVKLFWVIQTMAKEEGVKLSSEVQKAYEEQRATSVESLGSEEAYALYLKSMCLTEDGMKEINTVDALSIALEDKLCGEGKKFVATEDALRAYMDEREILKSKHILLMTKDPAVDGGDYAPEKMAEQKAKAEDILAQLRAAEDPIALFDTLMQEHSEDTGLSTNPDGYLFSTNPDGIDFTGRMVPEFEEGTASLAFDEISDIVESDYGYHIILRLDPLADEVTRQTYEDKWYGAQVDALYQERLDTMEIETTEVYDNLNAEEFYNKLSAHIATLEEEIASKEDAQAPEGDDTTAPEGDDTVPEGDDTTAPAGDDTAPEGEGQTDGQAPDGVPVVE